MGWKVVSAEWHIRFKVDGGIGYFFSDRGSRGPPGRICAAGRTWCFAEDRAERLVSADNPSSKRATCYVIVATSATIRRPD